MEWQETYAAGTVVAVEQTSDGGYVLATQIPHDEGTEMAVIRTDVSGELLWLWRLGRREMGSSAGRSIQPASDGGYVVVSGSTKTLTLIKLAATASTFRRGDCNVDGTVDISDALCILNWLFLRSESPVCVAVTNTNGDAGEDISDAVYLLTHLLLGGPSPVAPFPKCGPGTLPTDESRCEMAPANCPQ